MCETVSIKEIPVCVSNSDCPATGRKQDPHSKKRESHEQGQRDRKVKTTWGLVDLDGTQQCVLRNQGMEPERSAGIRTSNQPVIE